MAGGMIGWVEAHPDIALAGGVVGVLLIAGSFFKAKTPGTTTPNSNLGGLTNGIVYVPTQTSFTTNNRTQSGVFASNDPALTTVTTGPVNSPTTTRTNTHLPPTPIKSPPPPGPNPPPTQGKGLIWDQSYVIVGGDTLSAIAARQTTRLRAQGMPGSMSITWSDLYGHNTAVINQTSAAHHNPIPGGPWNDIFPGERITIPRWG